MKKLLLLAITIIAITGPSKVLADNDKFFELPIIPDTMSFYNRTSYLVTHYWDFCDLKKAFSSRQRMANAFKDYLDLMPYVSDSVSTASVNKFIKGVEKSPENLLFITRTAEEYMHSDTAAIVGDQLYLNFVKAVVANKKIDPLDKLRYEHQLRIIPNSMRGSVVPGFDYIDRSGAKRNFDADTAMVVLLYYYDTDCMDCSLARVRLDADPSVNKLIDAGRLKIVALTTQAADGPWNEAVAEYPSGWTVGSMPTLDEIIEVTSSPMFYLLDSNHRVLGPKLSIDQVLDISQRLAATTPDPYIRQQAAKMQHDEASSPSSH